MTTNNQAIIPKAYKFFNKLWEITSENINERLSEVLRNNMDIDEKMIRGIENLKRTLELYIKLLNTSFRKYKLTIYGSVILENGAIIRTLNKYHNKPWFSNVSIAMNSEEVFNYSTDNGLCYGQVRFFN